MQKITPFLWFDNNAEEAIALYTSVFPKSRIVSEQRAGEGGRLVSCTFELEGQRFMALNGGPHYKLTEAFSLFVSCTTQEEVDTLWAKLIANGGSESQCGWLKDPFGVSWQIIPTALMELMGDKNPAKAQAVMQAMLGMRKLDISGLKRAYEQA